MSNIAIAPSILSADFCNLERDLKAIANRPCLAARLALAACLVSWVVRETGPKREAGSTPALPPQL